MWLPYSWLCRLPNRTAEVYTQLASHHWRELLILEHLQLHCQHQRLCVCVHAHCLKHQGGRKWQERSQTGNSAVRSDSTLISLLPPEHQVLCQPWGSDVSSSVMHQHPYNQPGAQWRLQDCTLGRTWSISNLALVCGGPDIYAPPLLPFSPLLIQAGRHRTHSLHSWFWVPFSWFASQFR